MQMQSAELVYGLNDRPPIRESILVAIQHVFAIFVPIIAPGLIISSTLKLDPETTVYITGMALLASGIATFIQARTLGPVGSGLLSIQGTSFSFLGPIITAGTVAISSGKTPLEALPGILGLCFFGSLILVGVSRVLHLTQRVFTPLVTGIVVTCIGLTLIKVGITDMGGGANAVGTTEFGSLRNLGLSLLVLAIVTFCSVNSNRILRMGSIIIGLVIGNIAALITGAIDTASVMSTLHSLPLFHWPVPFRYGLSFDASIFISFAVVYIATTVECLGDITATCIVTGQPIEGRSYFKRVQAGILGDGVGSLLASVLGSFPTTTMGQNNGLIQLTGVGSRYIGYYVAGALILLGLFPIVGGLLQATPPAVLGGAIVLMFGSVAVSGIRILMGVGTDIRSSVIMAVSLSLALGVTFSPDILSSLPKGLQNIFSSGISTGAIAALVLNLAIPEQAFESEKKVTPSTADSTKDSSAR